MYCLTAERDGECDSERPFDNSATGRNIVLLTTSIISA